MPSPAPDVDPTTLSKVIIPYTVYGDTRDMVFYQVLADSNDTGTGGTHHGPEQMSVLIAGMIANTDTVGNGQVEHPDGTMRPTTGPGAGTNGEPTVVLPSNVAWHHIFKDSRRRACGHFCHGVFQADSAVAGAQTGVDFSGNAWFDPWKAEVISGHWYSKTGYKYTGYIHSKLNYRRSRATGGAGRKLTLSRAEAFLRRHGITSVPPA